MSRPRGRWMLVALVVALSGCRAGLQADLDEREANLILVVLAHAGVEGHKEHTGSGLRGWAISVAEPDLPAAVQILQAAGLPREHHPGFREVYAERGLVPGKLEERAVFLSALQAEIAQTLESVEGVISARVHATLRSEQAVAHLGAPVDQADLSAAVLITYRPDPSGRLPLSEQAVGKIVANAVDGLQADRVAVVFSPRASADQVEGPRDSAGNQAGWIRWAAAALSSGLLLACLVLVGLRRWRGAVWPFGYRT